MPLVADTRYTFTGQFLESSAIFVRRARDLEDTATSQMDDSVTSEHRGLITSVIMQSVAALETEAHEVCIHGPGAHLGSNHTDHQARLFLLPIADVIDGEPTLERFNLICICCTKIPWRWGRNPSRALRKSCGFAMK